MQTHKNKLLTLLGIFFIGYWAWDVITNAVLVDDYSWLLWYSSVGLLLTGIALILQNIKFLYSLFCALFILETLWVLDMMLLLFNHNSVLNLSHYLSSNFNIKDTFFVLYHALIPISLLYAVLTNKKTYSFGWVGAAIYAGVLELCTYLFTGTESSVNCIHSLRHCAPAISFFNKIQTPYRIPLGLFLLTFLIFIPTNYILLYFKKDKQDLETIISATNPLSVIKPTF